MNAPGYDKDYYEFVKLQRLKVEPSPLKNDIKWKDEPKPILFMKIPNGWVYEQSDMDLLEKQINNAGWFFLYFQTDVVDVMIESFTLKDSQEIQVQELKEIILNKIKGK